MTTITEPDKGQSVKAEPSSWQSGHDCGTKLLKKYFPAKLLVKTHMAQDYPLEQFKTVIIFSVTKYIPLILMVNLTPGILYHGNKNCDIW